MKQTATGVVGHYWLALGNIAQLRGNNNSNN